MLKPTSIKHMLIYFKTQLVIEWSIMAISKEKLKSRIIELLKKDEEFRYAVAGLIGLQEILKKLDSNEEAIIRNSEEIAKLRKDMLEGFKRHDEAVRRNSEEIRKLREDMLEGFKRHDELLKIHGEEVAKLRRDMIEGFNLMRRHLDALGARWGMLAESAFREGLRRVVERDLGLKVERWSRFDDKGFVFGYPSMVEIDVALRDEKVILVEIKSHVGRADVYVFKRKAELYAKLEGRKPSRLLMITPYADSDAFEAADKLGIEIYTKV